MAQIELAIVNEKDEIIGSAPIKEAYRKGLRHRIVLVLVLNSKGDIILQRRGPKMWYQPNKWDHSVGAHVDADEAYEDAVLREAREELGASLREIQLVEKYYEVKVFSHDVARQFTAVFKAQYDGPIQYEKEEVSEVRWIKPADLQMWMTKKPEEFTPSLHKTINLYGRHIFK